MKIKVLKTDSDTWQKDVLDCFTKNEPVALPTETVYGLAAPASSDLAIERIYEIKERPRFNPLILHVREDWKLDEFFEVNDLEKKLIEKFWPGPLSLLVKKKNVSDLVTAGSDYVVARAPAHPIFRQVLSALGAPLVAPSANSSTKLSPTTAQAVVEDLGTKLNLVVDGGICEWGVESTIVKVEGSSCLILREGALSREDIIAAGFKLQEPSSAEVSVTPGSQLKHYSPQIPLFLFENSEEWLKDAVAKTLFIQVLASDYKGSFPFQNLKILAPDDDFKTASKNLFDFLRSAQNAYSEIKVLKTKQVGLGRAINDRLERGSTRTK